MMRDRMRLTYVQPRTDPQFVSRSHCQPETWLSLWLSSFLDWGWTAERHAEPDTFDQIHIHASQSDTRTRTHTEKRELIME